jgi:uncharacterized membrane protein
MPEAYDELIFRRRLVPHRSLDRRGLRLLLGIFGACSFVSSLPFLFLGAWPVAGFMGLDVALVFLAFHANFRAARAYEDVSLTPLELAVARVTPTGARQEWRFSPGFVRLEREEHDDYGVTRVDLVSRGRRLELAAFLGPKAKDAFAHDLTGALAKARRGPRFS